MANKRRKMSMADRAKQFMPFAAVKGLKEAEIAATADGFSLEKTDTSGYPEETTQQLPDSD